MTTIDDPHALLRRIYEDGFNRGDAEVFDECYAPSFVHHSKVIHDVDAGGRGEMQSMLRLRDAIPDVRFDILDILVSGDRAVARLHIHGEARAPYGNVPSGPFDRHAVAWFRLVSTARGLQVAEEWLFTDAVA
jgi:predicted ester cyclase